MKKFLSGVDIEDGSLYVREVLNGSGDIATFDPSTKEVKYRTQSEIVSDIGAQKSIPLTVSTASATAAKTTVETVTFENGVLYMVKFTLGSSVSNPTINGVNIVLGGSNVNTTSFAISSNAVIPMFYNSTTNKLEVTGSYRNSDSVEDANMRWNQNVQVGSAVTRYKILMELPDGKFGSISIGDSASANTKTISTQEFRLGGAILYYSSTTTLASSALTSSCYSEITMGTVFAYTANQITGWTNYAPVYLKGTINANGNFVLDNTTLTSFMTQTLPTTEDGFVYILLGRMYTTTTSFRLISQHPIYEFKNGRIRFYESSDISTSSYQRDKFTYSGSNVFSITRNTANAVQVFLNGQKLEFTDDWSISGTNVTVNTPLITGDEISVEYFYSTPDVVSSNLNGTGTATYLAKWNGSAELGVSLIQDNGSVVTLPAVTDISAAAATVDTDKFVVLDGNRFKYRTGAQLLSDIGAQAAGSYVPTSRQLTINGTTFDLSANRTWTIAAGFDAVYDNGTSGAGTKNFDWSNGLTQKISLTGNSTWTFSNPSSGERYEVLISQDATGGRTITFPEIYWEGKSVPIPSSNANAKDKMVLTYDGSIYWGQYFKNFGVPSDLIIQTNLLFWFDPANTDSYPGSGTTWSDLTVNNWDATLVNGVSFTGADANGAMIFDGTNDYATQSNGVAASFVSQQSFTVGFWIKPDTSPPSQQTVWGILQSETTQSRMQLRIYSTGAVRLGYFAQDLDSSAGVITFGSWNYVVIQYDSSNDTSKIFVNGTQVASGNQGGLLAGTNRVVEFGRYNGAEYFKGRIGAVHAYTTAQSSTDINTNYDALRARYGL